MQWLSSLQFWQMIKSKLSLEIELLQFSYSINFLVIITFSYFSDKQSLSYLQQYFTCFNGKERTLKVKTFYLDTNQFLKQALAHSGQMFIVSISL